MWFSDDKGWKNQHSRREELRRRDRIRQAYFESQKLPAVDPDESEPEPEPEVVKAPLYFTQKARGPYYNVIGPEGKVNEKGMRLLDAEKLASQLNADVKRKLK